MKKFIENNTIAALLFVHILGMLLRSLLVIYGNIDLHTEEAQYWTWSQHLDWSYYSKPPMVAVLNYLSEMLFGHSEFSVRINAIVFGFLTCIVTYLFTKELFHNKLKAFIASILVYAMPFYQSSHLFFSTDAPLLFFAILAVYLGWLAIQYDKWKYWIGFSIAMGLGYLSKYAMLFFIPTTLLYLIIAKREVLRNKKLYVALGISFLFFLPVVIWNFKYDFIGLKHIVHLSGAASHRVYPFTRRLIKFTEYLSGQLAMISPLFLVFYFQAFRKYKLEKKALYLWLPALVSFTIFFIIAITKYYGANVNWTMFAYVGLPIFLAHYIVESNKLKTFSVLFSLTIGLVFLIVNMHLTDAVGIGKALPPKADPLKRMRGWEETVAAVDSIEQAQNTDKLFVFTDSYHTASELRFYSYPKTHYYYANRGNRMTQFSLWKGIEQYENQGYTAIFVSRNYTETPQEEEKLPADIAAAFDADYTYYTHYTHYRGKLIAQLHIYVLHNFKTLKTASHNY